MGHLHISALQPNFSASSGEGKSTVGEMAMELETTSNFVAAALNAVGLSPRDIIAIFQAIHQAGALKGELVIM